jgi:MFS transporter, CP family, cyanate transporter
MPGRSPETPALAAPLLLLWLFGICLRLTVLAVPPVIPLIHGSLSLSQTEVAALATLPVLLFSFAAVPGSMLIARFGAFAVLVAGTLLTGTASAARGLALDAPTLFAATFAMGVGIALMQPALPSVVREWVPQRVALGTAVYTNGLFIGEALPASMTIPWVLPAVAQSWRWALVAWSVPVIVIAMAGWWIARPRSRRAPKGEVRVWWPDWRSPVTWRLGLISGGTSSMYFGTNAFLPDYLARLGRADLLGPALSANNWMQVPASLVLLAFASRLIGRRGPIVAGGAVFIAAAFGIVLSSGPGVVFWSGMIGFCAAWVLTITLALPPMLVEPCDLPRVSAAMFAIGYLCAIVTPVLGGMAWDLTGLAWTAFVPPGVLAALMVPLALTLPDAPDKRKNPSPSL